MADVFEYKGTNPPGRDVTSQHDVVLWNHPQHGMLKAGPNGDFLPISVADANKLLGRPAPGAGTAPSPTPGGPVAPAGAETVPTGAAGAGSTKMNPAGYRGKDWYAEKARADAETSHQATMDRAKFAAPQRADPMAGLGLVERAKVQALVSKGIPVEEAVRQVRPRPAAAVQAEALKEQP